MTSRDVLIHSGTLSATAPDPSMAAPDPSMAELEAFLADATTPDTLTVDEILDAVTAGDRDVPGRLGRVRRRRLPTPDEARRRICEAIKKQLGGES